MNKKIIFGSVFTAFLIVSIPFITVAQEQQQEISYDELSSDPEVLLGTLVAHLQTIYDYIADNYDELIEEYPKLNDIDLQEFENSIDIISQGWESNPLFCIALAAIRFILVLISWIIRPPLPIPFLIQIAMGIIGVLNWIFCMTLSTTGRKIRPCECTTNPTAPTSAI